MTATPMSHIDDEIGYVLTPEDELIVQSTTKKVGDDAKQGIINIHRKQLAANWRRRAELERELRGIDRAVAMRRAAIEALGESWRPR